MQSNPSAGFSNKVIWATERNLLLKKAVSSKETPNFKRPRKKNALRYNTPPTSHRACPPWETSPPSQRFARILRGCSLAALLISCDCCGCLLLACVCLLDVDFCSSSSAACSSPSSNLPAYRLLLLWSNLCAACSRASLRSGTSMTGETTSSITPSHGSLNVFVWVLCCILLPCEDNSTRFNNFTAQAASSYGAGISQLFRAARMTTAAGTLCSTGTADSWDKCCAPYCSYIAHIITLTLGPVSVHVS